MCSRPGTFFWFHIWDNCDFNGQFATNSISSNVLNMPQAHKYWRNYVWQSKTIGFTPFFQATGGHQLGHTAHFCLLRPWKVGQTQSPDFPFCSARWQLSLPSNTHFNMNFSKLAGRDKWLLHSFPRDPPDLSEIRRVSASRPVGSLHTLMQ